MLRDPVPARAHRRDMLQDAGGRFGADERADIDREPPRIADLEFTHGAAQQLQDAVGRLLLKAQDAQGRAALPGRIEGGGDDVGHHLLGQGRGIRHQGVLSPRLGDERHGAPVRVQALAKDAPDLPRHRRGAREHHAPHPCIRHQGRADRTRPGQQTQGDLRDSRRVQHPNRLGGDERRLGRGFRQDRVAGRERCGDLPREDRQWEVPGGDAGHRPKGAEVVRAGDAPDLGSVEA